MAIRQGEKLYIQVANDISSPDTFRREIDPLLRVRDAYPKLLIARIWQPAWQHEGIQIIDAAEWLTGAVPQSEIEYSYSLDNNRRNRICDSIN